MDRVTSMAVFVRSVEGGSLAAAARHFGLSHAMVSKHLRALEQSLGVRLLTLTTRKLALTEAGDNYFRRCVQILADIEDANREAMQLQAVPRGLLRLTAPVAFGEQYLAPALADFLARYPEIVLDIELTDRFADLAGEGFDLALRIGRLPDSSLVARRLGASRMLTCAAPAYLARHGAPAHPSDLAAHRCLYLNVALEPSVATGDLVPVLADFASGALDIHALYLSKRHMSKKLRLLIDFLASRFSRPVGMDGV